MAANKCEAVMKIGDRVEITTAPENYSFFKVGDKASLERKDADGDWWAEFEEREWFDGDKSFCIQSGISACKLVV